MQEKIEWYREVLELEPSSKVFFPLSRLLAGLGRKDEAVGLLRQGLERHPEFIEARLYLVELLFKDGLVGECEEHLAKLTGTFTHYPGFWEAWGVCSQKNSKNRDLPLTISFLAAIFQNEGLSISEVLARGLRDISGREKSEPAKPETEAVAAVEPAPQPPDSPGDAPASTSSPAETDAAAKADGMPEPVRTAPSIMLEPVFEAEYNEKSGQERVQYANGFNQSGLGYFGESAGENPAEEPEDKIFGFSENSYAMPSASLEPDFDQKGDESGKEAEEGDFFQASESAPSLKEEEGENSGMRVSESSTMPLDSLVQSGQCEPGAPKPEEVSKEETEEQFSLRTKSMAEVLAEQGDVKGALDIYSELIESTGDELEKAELQARVAALSSAIPAKREGSELDLMPSSSPGKHRLLAILENLADRLDNRAQS